MTRQLQHHDANYDALSSPLKSLGKFIETQQEALLHEENTILEGTNFRRLGRRPPQRGTQVLQVGDLKIIAGKTTPVLSSNSSEHFSCFMAMPFIGSFTTRDGSLFDEVGAGDIYLNQNYYGTSRIGYLSSLFFALDRRRLDRVLQSMSGSESLGSLGPSLVIRHNRRDSSGAGGKLWSLIALIDQLHGEHAYMPTCLGLDDQFYRLLAFSLLKSVGRLESIQKRWEGSSAIWPHPLDNLVDFIRTHAHRHLTLTELEERSHYSARHLQNLFRQKLGCTPMQFIRRERLTTAMARLQAPKWDDTVTKIGREIGYRHPSSFTHDFKSEFGVNPSVILRASRSKGWQ